MVENPKIRKLLIIAIVVVFIMMFIPKLADVSDNPDQEELSGLGWHISGVREQRTESFWKCDATMDTVYFCYFDGCYIDAYSTKGEYLYTITLNESPNGGPSIHCSDELLYAKSPKHEVFVFDGTKMLEKITTDEAKTRGCNFMNLKSGAYVSKDSVYRILENGEHEFLFELPEEVTKTMSYFDYGDRLTKNRLYVAVTITAFLAFGVFVIYKSRKNGFKKASQS